MITIIDYGMGNLRSVQKSLEKAGAETRITQDIKEIESSAVLILPGVGAFGAAMQNLNEMGFIKQIKDYIKSGRPFLGICLGMQILFPYSEESPGIEGLGIFEGAVKRFAAGLQISPPKSPLKGGLEMPSSETNCQNIRNQHSITHHSNPKSEIRNTKLRVPHMGWNQLAPKKESDLLTDIAPDSYTYFVHSYYVDPKDKDIILTTTDYGLEFASAIQKDNVTAVQFHPEKSGEVGMKMLENYVEMIGRDAL
ncbi:MAG: imidazole glycerol phosphate synthase subunit HisH [Candidatus Margulisiibacteriota bacterium]